MQTNIYDISNFDLVAIENQEDQYESVKLKIAKDITDNIQTSTNVPASGINLIKSKLTKLIEHMKM